MSNYQNIDISQLIAYPIQGGSMLHLISYAPAVFWAAIFVLILVIISIRVGL